MPRQVVVTGATGFVGNNLVRRLLESGFLVRVIVRESSDPEPLSDLDVEIVQGELDDSQVLEKAIASSDYVVHAAASIWFGQSELESSRHINVHLTRCIAESCQRHNVRLIHISSVDALAAARSPDQPCDENDLEPLKSNSTYSVTKREADECILEMVKGRLDAVIIHPGFMIGPWDWKPSSGQMIAAVLNGIVPFAPGGGFSVVDVRNVVEGIIASFERGKSGERFILAGKNMTYLELWKMFAALKNKRWPKWAMPDWMATSVGWMGDIKFRLTGTEPVVNSSALALSQKYNYYSSEKAISELGYEITDIQTAIDDAYDWLKKYKRL